MGKRFTATEKWDDPWYRRLPPKYKCLWQLVIDKCDNSGVWTKDFEIIKHFIGEDVNEEEALKFFNEEKERIKILNKGKYWLVMEYISFQFGEVNSDSKTHIHVRNLIEKHRVSKGYPKGIHTPKVMVKVKDKVNIVGVVEKFDEVWALYPNKVGRKEALKHFISSIKTDKDISDIKIAIENYKQSDRVKKGFIQNGSTFFNDWQGWVSQVPPKADPLAKWENKK